MAYTPNTFHNDRWKISFSDFPTMSVDKLDMSMFDQFVKTVTLPNLSVELINSDYMSSTVRSPISRINAELNTLTIEFIADENLQNYFSFYNWFQMLRYHKLSTERISRDVCIKSIDVHLLDNQKRTTNILSFTKAFPTDISTIALQMGTSDESVFSVSFMYEELKQKLPE